MLSWMKSYPKVAGTEPLATESGNENDGDGRERHLALCPHIKKENWRGGWPWVGRCGLAWRGGGMGTGGHGLGWRPREEAGEGRGGSRGLGQPQGKSQRVLTPRGYGPLGSGQGANMCSLPPSQSRNHRLNLLAGQPRRR